MSESQGDLPDQELEEVPLTDPGPSPEGLEMSDTDASVTPTDEYSSVLAVQIKTRAPVQDRASKRRSLKAILEEYWLQTLIAAVTLVIACTASAAAVAVVPEVRRALHLDRPPTPGVPTVTIQTAALLPTLALEPSPVSTLPPTPSPIPYAVISVEQLYVYAGPGEDYELLGEVRRGDQLLSHARSEDRQWLQVDYLGRKGWIHAQGTRTSVELDVLQVAKAPPSPTRIPPPTETPNQPEPNTVLPLQNPSFEDIQEGVIPGWHWWAQDNFTPGGEYDSGTSFDTPFFSQASDPARMIDGPTLQIEAVAFVNFRVYIFQIASVVPGTTVRFQASAEAYSSEYRVRLAAGIDPNGGPDCSQAQWGNTLAIDQSENTVRLVTPEITAGDSGRVTICLRAENVYPAHCNAAYFDNAALVANPE